MKEEMIGREEAERRQQRKRRGRRMEERKRRKKVMGQAYGASTVVVSSPVDVCVTVSPSLM